MSNIPRIIVCAANYDREDNSVVLGIRHYDNNMRSSDMISTHTEQGFVDQRGLFLTRTEAWPVALAAGQIRRRVGGDDADGGTLYSENLY